MVKFSQFWLVLAGFYPSILFGQTTPEPFLPSFFAGYPHVRDLALSADGKEMYFTIESPAKDFSVIAACHLSEGKWQEPQVAAFSGQYRDLEPFLSPDGLHLYFASGRPLSGHDAGDVNIWMVSRAHAGEAWSDPLPVDAPIHSDKDEYYPSVAANGNLYFTRLSDDPAQKEDLYLCEKKDGIYQEPQALPPAINGTTYEFNAFIAPDESYILFSSYGRSDDLGGSDLYISRKGPDGIWQTAQHLDVVNSTRIDYCPFVDADQLRLYFTSERSAVPGHFDKPLDLPQILWKFRQPAHGSGRIYSIDLKEVIRPD